MKTIVLATVAALAVAAGAATANAGANDIAVHGFQGTAYGK